MSDFVDFIDGFRAEEWPEPIRDRLWKNAVALTGDLEALGFRTLVGHDLKRIARHQAQHSDMVLSPPFDPRRFPEHDEADAVVIVLEKKDGSEAGVCGSRLFWVENTFREALNGLIFPDCIVTAPSVERVYSCNVAWSGAMHLIAGLHKNVFPLLSRTHHLWDVVHWRFSYLAGMSEEAITRRYANKGYGFPIIERGLWRAGNEYSLYLADRRFCAQHAPRLAYADVGLPFDQPEGALT